MGKICHFCCRGMPPCHYWNYYPGAPSLSQATATYLKIMQTQILSADAWSSNELQRRGYMAGYQDGSPSNGCWATRPVTNPLTSNIYIFAHTVDSLRTLAVPPHTGLHPGIPPQTYNSSRSNPTRRLHPPIPAPGNEYKIYIVTW